MDPLSIASGVMSLVVDGIATAKLLYDLRDKYKNASTTITAIYTESMVISASLSQIQALQARNAMSDKPELYATFDIAITGCNIVFSCLKEEVGDLADKALGSDGLNWKDKAKMIWREDAMKELLQQLRGQQTALTLLIQGLQMESLSDIQKLLHDNNATLVESVSRSKSLRASHPNVRVPESVFELENSNDSTFGAHSATDQAEFDFDDVVVNSKAYRRAMALARAQKAPTLRNVEPIEGDLIDFNEPEVPETTEPDANELSPDMLNDLQHLTLEQTAEPNDESNEDFEAYSAILNDLDQNMLPFMPPLALVSSPEPQPAQSPGERQDLRIGRCDSEPVDTQIPPPLPPRRSTIAAGQSGPPPAQPTSGPGDDLASSLSRPSTMSMSSVFSQSTIAESYTTIDSLEASTITPSAPTLSDNPHADCKTLWRELVQAEVSFIERLDWFRENFRAPVFVQWPILAKHLDILQHLEALSRTHEKSLLLPMQEQLDESADALCDAGLFRDWLLKMKPIYQAYHQRLPHAETAIRLTLAADKKFEEFVAGMRFAKMWDGSGWEDFIRLPVSQLQFSSTTLEKLASIDHGKRLSKSDSRIDGNLQSAAESLGKLHISCQSLLKASSSREEVLSLYRRIYTLDTSLVERLELHARERKIVFQRQLAARIKGRGPWLPVHLVLLDNYLFWSRSKTPKPGKNDVSTMGKRKLWVLEAPMPLKELSVLLPNEVNQSIKTTLLDNVPRGSMLYQFSVQVGERIHSLGTISLAERQQLTDRIQNAIDAANEITR
ncbi:hypothetical protein K402DRAFT_425161 [Aulographum hederae CBS 113979]|uniref:DH domain-containing protein n=1 Tax=Aulographum hederae CBS 113979 TaxID=1176131 RepID=A0A6G1GLA9_9PEZI|nr:hypothetical protein K402DRAFT_425161 [Aulographum hederae CBS 113979]